MLPATLASVKDRLNHKFATGTDSGLPSLKVDGSSFTAKLKDDEKNPKQNLQKMATTKAITGNGIRDLSSSIASCSMEL